MSQRPRPRRTHYQVLMLDQEADADLVSVVYRRLAQQFHPDLHPDAAPFREMLEVNRAYDVLRDPERRARYDEQLSLGSFGWDDRA